MTFDYKVLGQAYPGAATFVDLYTVPAATQTIGSTLVVCNQAVSTTFRVTAAVAGAVLANAQYLFADTTLGGNETETYTIGLTLAATDVIRVYSASGNVSFTLFGTEITA